MILRIHLADGVDDDAVFVDNIGGTQCTLGHLAIHLLLSPSLVSLQDSEIRVSNQMEWQLVFCDEVLVRFGAVSAKTQHVIA